QEERRWGVGSPDWGAGAPPRPPGRAGGGLGPGRGRGGTPPGGGGGRPAAPPGRAGGAGGRVPAPPTAAWPKPPTRHRAASRSGLPATAARSSPEGSRKSTAPPAAGTLSTSGTGPAPARTSPARNVSSSRSPQAGHGHTADKDGPKVHSRRVSSSPSRR